MKLLEVCIDCVESAIAAQKGGADRLELCSALVIGGLSPSPALYEAVRAETTLPIHAMIRPRFGDFLYSSHERAVMLREARMWREAGAEGVVFGALQPDGRLDSGFLRSLIEATPGMRHTLHRAFDLCRDPFEALEEAIALGFNTLLTSGQAPACLQGQELLRDLHERAAGRIVLLAGAGINAGAIPVLHAATGILQYHLSGKRVLESGMAFRRPGVPMGLPGFSEYERWESDESAIRRAADALAALPEPDGPAKGEN